MTHSILRQNIPVILGDFFLVFPCFSTAFPTTQDRPFRAPFRLDPGSPWITRCRLVMHRSMQLTTLAPNCAARTPQSRAWRVSSLPSLGLRTATGPRPRSRGQHGVLLFWGWAIASMRKINKKLEVLKTHMFLFKYIVTEFE